MFLSENSYDLMAENMHYGIFNANLKQNIDGKMIILEPRSDIATIQMFFENALLAKTLKTLVPKRCLLILKLFVSENLQTFNIFKVQLSHHRLFKNSFLGRNCYEFAAKNIQ